jgi:hypothetical protein
MRKRNSLRAEKESRKLSMRIHEEEQKELDAEKLRQTQAPEIWASEAEDLLYELVKPTPVTGSFIIRDEDQSRTFSELKEKLLKPCVEKLAKQLTRVGEVVVEISYDRQTAGVKVTVTVK